MDHMKAWALLTEFLNRYEMALNKLRALPPNLRFEPRAFELAPGELEAIHIIRITMGRIECGELREMPPLKDGA